jgi:hypothetical protein
LTLATPSQWAEPVDVQTSYTPYESLIANLIFFWKVFHQRSGAHAVVVHNDHRKRFRLIIGFFGMFAEWDLTEDLHSVSHYFIHFEFWPHEVLRERVWIGI